ncbi:MAG: zinc-dependent metalloprotease [Planctomycetota bacterium]|jgi:hypothetical protein
MLLTRLTKSARTARILTGAAITAALSLTTVPAFGAKDFKPFDEVSKGFTKVNAPDGARPFISVWVNKKTNQLLAELPGGWSSQKHYIAATQASGAVFAGLQGPATYVYWKRYDKRLALLTPETATRSDGEAESKSSVKRLFTDRVLVDIPIVAMGPGGQPVIDLDDLLVAKASTFTRGRVSGMNARLARVVKTKVFPQNIEIAIEAPMRGGQLSTVHYSISKIPNSTGYKPRVADERVGYFTTVYRNLGEYDQDKKWVRYIDRWHLEKRDPKLRLSPPKEPLIFYVEHTVPVRYRRYVRRGLEYWNEAFEKVGLIDAIEVRYQDKNTGAHMEKDPEDVRYNFIRWLNNDISMAIGPHRAHPLTGQILDADVVLTDGWIRAYWHWYNELAPELAVESFSADTLDWLQDHPEWDPRILLATPEQKEHLLAQRAERKRRIAAGEAVAPVPADSALTHHPELAEVGHWLDDEHHHCMAAHALAFDMAFARLGLEMGMPDETFAGPSFNGGDDQDVEKLDGIPEWFIGPLLAELVAHEVGHTLGLRHNFKASSIYSIEEINSEEWRGNKALAGSVMDYLAPNFNMESGDVQGDIAMITIGPYDHWAIEYGYTFGKLDKVLERVSEPELAYLTDDDTRGPDPFARRRDATSDPLAFAENQMRIVRYHRDRIIDEFVKEGQSWSKARRGYSITLGTQTSMLSMMANWIGGAHVNRDRKGDPGDRPPIVVVDPERQRAALQFVIDNAFHDEAFGLTPELLTRMTVDKWSDRSPGDRGDSTWEVHDRIMATQASSLTMVMNLGTLRRVYDNELRTPADEDALTLPEILVAINDAIYSELDTDLNGVTFTNRKPMISSLRRNLQSTLADRLIYFTSRDKRLPRPIRTMSTAHLRRLSDRLEAILEHRDTGQIDEYTLAHLDDLHERVTKALNRIYVADL